MKNHLFEIIVIKYDKYVYVRLIITWDNVILRLGIFSC